MLSISSVDRQNLIKTFEEGLDFMKLAVQIGINRRSAYRIQHFPTKASDNHFFILVVEKTALSWNAWIPRLVYSGQNQRSHIGDEKEPWSVWLFLPRLGLIHFSFVEGGMIKELFMIFIGEMSELLANLNIFIIYENASKHWNNDESLDVKTGGHFWIWMRTMLCVSCSNDLYRGFCTGSFQWPWHF